MLLEIPAGESLQDHQVHERAWVTVIDGEVEITTTAGQTVAGGSGLMVEFAPGERHAVLAQYHDAAVAVADPVAGRRPSRRDVAQRQGHGQATRGRAPDELMTAWAGSRSGLWCRRDAQPRVELVQGQL